MSCRSDRRPAAQEAASQQSLNVRDKIAAAAAVLAGMLREALEADAAAGRLPAASCPKVGAALTISRSNQTLMHALVSTRSGICYNQKIGKSGTRCTQAQQLSAQIL